jgi:hypothetical protein
MREVCGKCKYNKRVVDGHCNAEFCCGNEESEYYSVPTFRDDTCDSYEPKESQEDKE